MVDLSAAEEAWALVKDPADEHAYAVFGMSAEDPKRVELLAKGRCGLERITPFITEDSVVFGVIRVYAVTAGNRSTKYVYFLSVGRSAPIMKKAKAQNYKASWSGVFEGVHVSLEVAGPEDLSEENLSRRLTASGGGHAPDSYVFGTGNADDLELEEVEAARAAEEAARLAAEEAEAARLAAEEEEAARVAAEEARMAEARRLAIKRTARDVRKGGKRNADVRGFDFATLSDGFYAEDFTDVVNERSWVVMSLGDDKKTVQVDAEGSGGLDEIKAVLKDDAMQFAAFRVNVVDRSGARASLRCRTVFVEWVGGEVSRAEQFKYNNARAAFEEYFSDSQLTLKLNGRAELDSELTEENIQKEIRRLAGAHQHQAVCRFGYYDILRQAEDTKAHAAASETA